MRMQLAAFVAVLGIVALAAAARSAAPNTAPEFTHVSSNDWINSAPLSLEQLRGKPVLIEFWTFDCINCRNSLDWMKSIVRRKTASGLAVVAVHTPELAHERVPQNVRAAVRKLGIDYPVMLDRDFSYWNALDNQYWPAFYLIDKHGRVRSKAIGELHADDRRAREFEAVIDRVLKE